MTNKINTIMMIEPLKAAHILKRQSKVDVANAKQRPIRNINQCYQDSNVEDG